MHPPKEGEEGWTCINAEVDIHRVGPGDPCD